MTCLTIHALTTLALLPFTHDPAKASETGNASRPVAADPVLPTPTIPNSPDEPRGPQQTGEGQTQPDIPKIHPESPTTAVADISALVLLRGRNYYSFDGEKRCKAND